VVDVDALHAEVNDTLASLAEDLGPLVAGTQEAVQLRQDRLDRSRGAVRCVKELAGPLGRGSFLPLLAAFDDALDDLRIGRVEPTLELREVFARALSSLSSLLARGPRDAAPPTDEELSTLVITMRSICPERPHSVLTTPRP
jgi:hypothetical protein